MAFLRKIINFDSFFFFFFFFNSFLCHQHTDVRISKRCVGKMHRKRERMTNVNEPPHDKTNKMTVRPAKTQISLGIRLV